LSSSIVLESEFVKLNLQPKAAEVDDINSVAFYVSLEATEIVYGIGETSLYVHDLNRFLKGLQEIFKSLNGRVELESVESDFYCSVVASRGQLHISGKLQTLCDVAVIAFAFDSDQTFLSRIL